MKRQLGLIQPNLSKTSLILIVITGVGLIGKTSHVYAQNTDLSSRANYERRLEFYLNRKSDGFISEMMANEQVRLQFSKNVRKELVRRGLYGMRFDGTGIPARDDSGGALVSEYWRELSLLTRIVDQIRTMELRSAEDSESYSLAQLSDLRQHLLRLLDVEPRFEDDGEAVDPSLFLSERLNTLARSKQFSQDRRLLEEVAGQVNSLSKQVARSSSYNRDSIASGYVQEVNLLTDILEELEDLRKDAEQRNIEVSSEIEELRTTILASLDSTLLSIMGYKASFASNGPTVSEIFEQWKATEYTKFQIRFTDYQIKKNWLLENGSSEEKDRMLGMDLKTAFSSFIDGEHRLAQKEFDQILQDFGPNFRHIETVLFYRAESNYLRKMHEEARVDYSTIVSDFSNSDYFGDSIYRLMTISEQAGKLTEFSKYFQLLRSSANRLDRETLDKCNYFAAHVELKEGKFVEAEKILTAITEDSKYFPMASYLLGIVYVNQDNYSKALDLFEKLVDPSDSPSSDPALINVRNSARLKLGLLYYELGEFEEAIKYLGSVAEGFSEHDKSVACASWAHFKLGDFEKATKEVETLLKTDLSSQYTYEALVLAAHCRKTLQQQDSALTDLRYVTSARRVSELSHAYNKERAAVLQQLFYLDQLEGRVLENRNAELFALVSETRVKLEDVLASFPYYGTAGTLILEQFNDERQRIVKQIEELDEIVSSAYSLGDKKSVKKAEEQRARLIRSFVTYRADQSIEDVNSFLDYPLATKEGAERYRKNILRNLRAAIQIEHKRIQENLKRTQSLQALYNPDSGHDISTGIDLEIIRNDLQELKSQSNQFLVSLNEKHVDGMMTDFDRWAEFSGFGMSDLTFAAIRDIEAGLVELSQNYAAITKLLEAKELGLELKALERSNEAGQLEATNEENKLKNEERGNDELFRESYFDTKERETGGV